MICARYDEESKKAGGTRHGAKKKNTAHTDDSLSCESAAVRNERRGGALFAAFKHADRAAANVFGWLVLTLALLLGQKTRQSAQRRDVLFVLLSGVCSTGLGSYLYFSSIPRLPVREVSVLGYVEPLSALVFSAVLLGERLLPAQLLGAGLILGGTLVMELFRAKI